MNTEITKEKILKKTHRGLNIYSHILQKYYPGETVMYLSGRECRLTKNPFNKNMPTLKIWLEKTSPEMILSPELAHHKDTENAIAPGDAFDFARLHYKQEGEQLLEVLNQDLHLRLDERPYDPATDYPYHVYFIEDGVETRAGGAEQFLRPSVPVDAADGAAVSGVLPARVTVAAEPVHLSFFRSPITNTTPHKTATLRQIYNAIRGTFYKQETQVLRGITDPKQARRYKASHFDYCTFSGIFASRCDKALVKHSGLLCVDFDHIDDLSGLRDCLLGDKYYCTEMLFVSPSGTGLKWIISIDIAVASHAEYFIDVYNYIHQTYHYEIDKSGKDVSRACFLPYDPNAYINPQHLL